MTLLRKLKNIIEQGTKVAVIQITPHIILIDHSFYWNSILPLLAMWLIPWLQSKGLSGVEQEKLMSFLLHNDIIQKEQNQKSKPIEQNNDSLEVGITPSLHSLNTTSKKSNQPQTFLFWNNLSSEAKKILNLSHLWIWSYLPHVLSKVCLCYKKLYY
jgi:hypothetical protein